MTDVTQLPLFPEAEEKPLLDSFTIGAFRGLHDLTLERLGRINLLVGKNNSGKTSVLEALAIYAGPEDFRTWTEIAGSRNAGQNHFDKMTSLEWLFPKIQNIDFEGDRNQRIDLTGRGATESRQLIVNCETFRGIPPQREQAGKFRRAPPDDPIEEDDGITLRGTSSPRGLEFAHTIWRHNGYRRSSSPPAGRPVTLLPPYGHRSETEQLGYVTRAIEQGYKSQIDNLLGRLDDNIQGMEILTTEDGWRPRLMIRHKQTGLSPVNVLGDGVRRALSVALTIPLLKSGLLLIDEIESALHVSVLDTLYPWLIEACAEYNVQVFATTHSLEAVDAIAKIDHADGGGLSAYHLENEPGKKPRRYTGDALRELVHENGLDIR